MQDIKKFPTVGICAPEIPQVRKIVSLPHKMIYINTAAAPGANVIRLVQREEEMTIQHLD